MPNTRQAAKRARLSQKRQIRNTQLKTGTKTAVRKFMDALATNKVDEVKAEYKAAIQKLGKASSKGIIPKARAARKISRLTKMVKKNVPTALPFAHTPSSKQKTE